MNAEGFESRKHSRGFVLYRPTSSCYLCNDVRRRRTKRLAQFKTTMIAGVKTKGVFVRQNVESTQARSHHSAMDELRKEAYLINQCSLPNNVASASSTFLPSIHFRRHRRHIKKRLSISKPNHLSRKRGDDEFTDNRDVAPIMRFYISMKFGRI